MAKITECIVRGRKRYRLDIGVVEGKRHRLFFAQKEEAEENLRRREKEIRMYGEYFAEIPARQRVIIADALQRLQSARCTITEAVDYFLKHRGVHTGVRKVKDCVQDLLASKAQENCRPRSLTQLRSSLGMFTAEFGDRWMNLIRPGEIEAWLGGHSWGPATRRSYLGDVRNLFSYALKRGYLSHDCSLSVAKPRLDDDPPGILTVDQCIELLRVTQEHVPRFLTFLVLCLFAGIRPEECARLNWDLINLEEKFIDVPAKISKTRRRRLVEIQPVLIQWLMLCKRIDAPLPPVNLKRLFDRARDLSNLRKCWPHDALRHSFASYHLAHFKSADRTATELGHGSTQMLFSNYRAIVRPAEAARFWELAPGQLHATSTAIPADSCLILQLPGPHAEPATECQSALVPSPG